MGKRRGDFTQNFNRDDARLLFLCPKLSKNQNQVPLFMIILQKRERSARCTIDNCAEELPLRPLCLFVGQNVCQSRSAIFTICSAFHVLHYKIPSFGPKLSLKSAKLYFCSDVWCVKGSRTNKKMQENIWRIIIIGVRSCHSRHTIWIIYRYFFVVNYKNP